jgi:Concanavalin A-like lectin/glucanases superfamily
VIRFNGTQSLYLDIFAQPTTFTVFVVGKNSMPSESFSMILGPGGNAPNNQLRWENGSQALFVGTGNNLPIITSSLGNTRIYHALSASYNGAVMNVYRDGNAVSSHPFTTTGPWTLASVGSWYSSYYMQGDLAEVVIYDRALSESERASVNAYLRSKYFP